MRWSSLGGNHRRICVRLYSSNAAPAEDSVGVLNDNLPSSTRTSNSAATNRATTSSSARGSDAGTFDIVVKTFDDVPGASGLLKIRTLESEDRLFEIRL